MIEKIKELFFPEWQKHRSKWVLFWTNCCSTIWEEWMINNEHTNHILVKCKEAFEKIQIEAKKEIDYRTSLLKTREDLGGKIMFRMEVNELIF